MNIRVIYHSKTGNTKKLAESMAGALGVRAETIDGQSFAEPVDMLFLGDGVYGGRPDRVTVGFIKSLNGSMVKNAAVFGTYGGQKKAIEAMKGLLKEQGINVLNESFGCSGKSWAIFNRKHPSAEDMQAANEFAVRVSKEVK